MKYLSNRRIFFRSLSVDIRQTFAPTTCIKTTKIDDHRLSRNTAETWQIPCSKVSQAVSSSVRWMMLFGTKTVPANGNVAVSTKPPIDLSFGDPTVYRNFLPPMEMRIAVGNSAQKPNTHGYIQPYGSPAARQAVADYLTMFGLKFSADDILMMCGTLQAIETSLAALADPGDNILVPLPGFTSFVTLCKATQVEPRFYNLQPENNWQVDLAHLQKNIDQRTRAVLINSPSNPTGSVFSRQHLLDIINVCEQHRLPIIADEVYTGLAFPGVAFHPIATLTDQVPVLTCGSISKLLCCPGWRCGWLAIHDPQGHLSKTVRPALIDLTARLLGPCSLLQAALPDIFRELSADYITNYVGQLQKTADVMFTVLSKASPCVHPYRPQGSIFFMMRIDPNTLDETINNDIEFCQRLVLEQAVTCVPCITFGIDNHCRLITTVPIEMVQEACERIVEFCRQHRKTIA